MKKFFGRIIYLISILIVYTISEYIVHIFLSIIRNIIISLWNRVGSLEGMQSIVIIGLFGSTLIGILARLLVWGSGLIYLLITFILDQLDKLIEKKYHILGAKISIGIVSILAFLVIKNLIFHSETIKNSRIIIGIISEIITVSIFTFKIIKHYEEKSKTGK